MSDGVQSSELADLGSSGLLAPLKLAGPISRKIRQNPQLTPSL